MILHLILTNRLVNKKNQIKYFKDCGNRPLGPCKTAQHAGLVPRWPFGYLNIVVHRKKVFSNSLFPAHILFYVSQAIPINTSCYPFFITKCKIPILWREQGDMWTSSFCSHLTLDSSLDSHPANLFHDLYYDHSLIILQSHWHFGFWYAMAVRTCWNKIPTKRWQK